MMGLPRAAGGVVVPGLAEDPREPPAGPSRWPVWAARLDRIDRRLAAAIPESRDRLVVSALVLVAFVLRVPNLGRAFWIDEAISVGIASHPVGQIPAVLRLDGSPPLWYLLLHYWIVLFGTSVVATHLLPLGISLLVTPLAYWAGRRTFGRGGGLAAAFLSATNPFLSWYGTEARMYTLVVALGLVALTCTVAAVRTRGRADVTGAVLAFAALLYTHDWALYLVAVTGLMLLVHAWRTRDRALAVRSVAAGAVVLALYAPWLPTFLFQARTTGAPWAVPPQIGDLFADPANTLGGTLDVFVVPLLAAAVWHTHRDRGVAHREAATFLGVSALGATLAGWMASQIVPSWTIRYLAIALGPLLLAIAGSLASTLRGRVVLAVTCTALTAWSAVGTFLPNANARYAKSNVGAVAQAAAPSLHPGDLVITTQTEQLALLAYYLPAGLRFATPTGIAADPHVVDWQNLVSRLQHANACQTLLPALEALPVGAHVLEINPLRAIGASGSTWSRAVNHQVVAVDSLIAAQPALVAGASYTEGTLPKPYSAVVGQLFTRIAGPMRCP